MRSMLAVTLGVILLSVCPIGTASIAQTPNQDVLALHLDWLDKSVDPTKNFYLYANGDWKKKNPIPAAYSSWTSIHVLQEHTLEVIRNILVKAANNSNNIPGSIQQKVGDFYFSGMNEKAINSAGIKPLVPELDRINQIKNKRDLQQVVAHLQMIGTDALFDFQPMQDFKDSTKVIGVATQGALSLPDRDYYLKTGKKFRDIRQAFSDHIARTFELLGDDKNKSQAEAKVVIAIETELAKGFMTRIQLRDPRAVYHPMAIAELDRLSPDFSWKQYFSDIGLPDLTQINFAMPGFFKVMNSQLKKVSLSDWKIYLRWHLIDSFSPYLSEAFVREDFKMKAALTGVQEQLPRWKRVVTTENQALGFAIGKLYVEQQFPASSKKAVEEIIINVRAALKNDLQHLTWMNAKTKQAALEKLDKMEARVGYPDKWWDYSSLNISRDSYVLNMMRASEFLAKRDLNKIGKPVDKTEWDMTPQTINAYYDASMNRLNIPAGILQTPFFDPNASAAINYGAIGFVVGHEMTHGFDDQGAQFDGMGNLKNWWTKDDLKKFQEKTGQIANQFSEYTVDGGAHVQGKLVMGEAAADFGGLTLAYRALHALHNFKDLQNVAGFTPDQQFFLSAAHIWASNVRPMEAERLVMVDPHPPAMYRVNGTMENMPEFKRAFNIDKNSPMVNSNCPVIW